MQEKKMEIILSCSMKKKKEPNPCERLLKIILSTSKCPEESCRTIH